MLRDGEIPLVNWQAPCPAEGAPAEQFLLGESLKKTHASLAPFLLVFSNLARTLRENPPPTHG
jgi:hypothetical protein